MIEVQMPDGSTILVGASIAPALVAAGMLDYGDDGVLRGVPRKEPPRIEVDADGGASFDGIPLRYDP